MTIEGNPFAWGFNDQVSFTTLAKQMNATYNETAEGTEQKTAAENFFIEGFGESSNVAHITGATALDPQPYIVSTDSAEKDENCIDVVEEEQDIE